MAAASEGALAAATAAQCQQLLETLHKHVRATRLSQKRPNPRRTAFRRSSVPRG